MEEATAQQQWGDRKVAVAPPNKRPDFEAIARQEIPMLYRVAKMLTQDSARAEDIVGITLLACARTWHRFEGTEYRAWMLKILTNAYKKEIGKLAQRPTVFLETELVANENEVEDAHWRITRQNIANELLALPEEQRVIVTLCDVEQMSYEEAATALDIPIGTVRSRLFRARRRLRIKLISLLD